MQTFEREINGKKYSFTGLRLRDAANLQSRVLALIAAFEKGQVHNHDDFFDIGCRFLQFAIVDGTELASIEDVEAYYTEHGIEEFNIAVFEAFCANYPKLTGGLNFSAVVQAIQGKVSQSE